MADPRHPRGRRHVGCPVISYCRTISIHALREEGDPVPSVPTAARLHFYPRPPRGGRLIGGGYAAVKLIFLSTPSARRATAKTERKPSAFVSLYTSLHKLQRGACKTNRKSHRYLCKRLVFRCEASGKTMCAAGSHWPSIKRSAHYPVQTPGAAQRARP